MAQDYIQRLLQQVAQMLAAILAHRQAGRNIEAKEAIERSCFQTTGIPLLLAKLSSPEDLLQMLDSGPTGLRCSRKILLAELLLQDAEIDEAAGRMDEATRSETLAACLLHAAIDSLNADEAAAYGTKLESLQRKLPPLER
jgi:hypothetical protein